MASNVEETPDDRLIFAALTDENLDKLDRMEEALRDGANVNARVADGTLLHYVITTGKYQAAEYLVTRGADVNAADDFGSMPLHLAAMHGRSGLASELMKRGADRLARDKPIDDQPGKTPHELTPYGKIIEWDQLSDEAKRALKSKKRQDLTSLLLADGQPTQALLELCGTHRIIELFHPGKWTGRVSEALSLFEEIEPSLPAYWRNLNPIDLTPLRRSAVNPGDAITRYVRPTPICS